MTLKITAILHGQDQNNGDYYHRVLWPYQALSEHVYVEIVQMTHPDVYLKAAQAEILVVHMIADEGLLQIIQHRRKHGRPTITEISDDFTTFPSTTMLHHFYADPNNQNIIIDFMKSSDGVQFSSPFLEQKYRNCNSKTIVFMNQLWDVSLPEQKRIHRPLRLGWVGSGGHVLDAEELSSFLQKCPSLKKFSFSIMTTKEIASIFTRAGIDVTHHSTGNFESYLDFISSLDIGIAHVMEEDFALGRSDGKYLEYTTQGVISICSKRGTFASTIRHGDNGYTYSTSEDLQNILELLDHDETLVENIRNNEYQDVKQHRNHRVNVERKLNWYKSFINCDHQHPRQWKPQLHFVHHPIEEKLKKLLEEHNYHPQPNLLTRYKEIAKICPHSNYTWQGLHLLASQFGWEKERNMFERMDKKTHHDAIQKALNWSM